MSKLDNGKGKFAASKGIFSTPFLHFRRILNANTRIIEKIGQLEQALGGEFIFDQSFMGNAVDELISLVRQVIYDLNALSNQRYHKLYDQYTKISNHLMDLLAGGPGPYDRRLVLSYELLHRDLDHVVGAKNAVLGELTNQMHLTVPDGFAITINGYDLFLEQNGLGGSITAILNSPGITVEKSETIKRLILETPIPIPLELAVDAELKALKGRRSKIEGLAVRSSAVGEDGERSFAGQFLTLLNVQPRLEALLAAYKQLLASRFSAQVLDYMGSGVTSADVPLAVGVQEMLQPDYAGVFYTRDPNHPNIDRLLVSAVEGNGVKLVDGSVKPDRYLINRRHPFDIISSEVGIHSNQNGGNLVNSDVSSTLRRGSFLLNPAKLRLLVEHGLLLEKTFDGPLDIEWAIVGSNLIILQSRPLILPESPTPPPHEVMTELENAEILLQGRGHVVQLGVASGPVFRVPADIHPTAFPVGAIAVTNRSSPRLSPIVRRAAAIISDIGSPTGHLATIAREYRTPALFGTEVALKTLTQGQEITLDVENKTVYAGCIKSLIRSEATSVTQLHGFAELKILRRLLRWIAPLYLIDPQSSKFREENCLTLHDIIRFCHEKAVTSIIDLHGSGLIAKDLPRRRLEVSLPLDLYVIDLDCDPQKAKTDLIRLEEIQSRPFKALMEGLLNLKAWDREPTHFGFKDLVSSIGRPVAGIVNPPDYKGNNIALVGEDYCNLSLRLGYHFNVIDTYLSEEVESNYIYFRFVGGFAQEMKRMRRIELISVILTGLHFKVDCQGDLLVAKIKMLDPIEMFSILIRLGELVAFTRQLDVQMVDGHSIESYFNDFLEKIQSVEEKRPS